MGSTSNILQSAKATLDKANNFTKSVEGHTPGTFSPKESKPSTAAPTDYSHARTARKSEFMGVRSDEAPELKSALDQREQAKKALEQQ